MLQWVGLEQRDIDSIFRVVGAILHLGNVEFSVGASNQRGGAAKVSNPQVAQQAATLLGVQSGDLEKALTHRTHKSGCSTGTNTLNVQGAIQARDSLAKSLYGKNGHKKIDRLGSLMCVSTKIFSSSFNLY